MHTATDIKCSQTYLEWLHSLYHPYLSDKADLGTLGIHWECVAPRHMSSHPRAVGKAAGGQGPLQAVLPAHRFGPVRPPCSRPQLPRDQSAPVTMKGTMIIMLHKNSSTN